jgi:hypothetical protein
VDGGAEKFEVLPVEPEAGVRFEFKLAHTEGDALRLEFGPD